ncbi:alpha-mannosidase [Nakamurella antarctica]|uniref:Alpha-mannosidase n=1 Tax=Nakamurella antarctica TaxID=1902245 RepID=A0A3G8ZQW0_9ACTN|nr:antitoxin VbhA family protein [Nakamurella antarctica]AZI59195.1 alpha-mannosidase [Nakamurella antarctica]
MTPIRYAQIYPDAFESLTPEQCWNVEQTLANHRLEGMNPDHEDVLDLAQFVAGLMTREQHMQRSLDKARAVGSE